MQISNPQPIHPIQPSIQINGLQILRLIIYFYIVIKILQIFLDHFRKESVKDRLGKRFQIAYAPIMGSLTKQEMLDLQSTLKNTETNVEVKDQAVGERKIKGKGRRIQIDEKMNQYYNHVEIIEGGEEEGKTGEGRGSQNDIQGEEQNHKIQEIGTKEERKEEEKEVQEVKRDEQRQDNDQEQKPLIDTKRIEETENEQGESNIENGDQGYSTE